MIQNPLLLKKSAASLNKASPYSNHVRCESGIAREFTGQRRNRISLYDAYLTILNKGGEPL